MLEEQLKAQLTKEKVTKAAVARTITYSLGQLGYQFFGSSSVVGFILDQTIKNAKGYFGVGFRPGAIFDVTGPGFVGYVSIGWMCFAYKGWHTLLVRKSSGERLFDGFINPAGKKTATKPDETLWIGHDGPTKLGLRFMHGCNRVVDGFISGAVSSFEFRGAVSLRQTPKGWKPTGFGK